MEPRVVQLLCILALLVALIQSRHLRRQGGMTIISHHKSKHNGSHGRRILHKYSELETDKETEEERVNRKWHKCYREAFMKDEFNVLSRYVSITSVPVICGPRVSWCRDL